MSLPTFESLLDARAKRFKRVTPGDLKRLKKFLCKVAQKKLKSSKPPEITTQDLTEWQRNIFKSSGSIERVQACTLLLIKTLNDAEEHLGWPVPKMPRLMILKSEPPSLTFSDLSVFNQLGNIQQALAQRLQGSSPSVADIFLSARVFGFYSGRPNKWTRAFDDKGLRRIGGQWLLCHENETIAWIADPITNRLLNRLSRKPAREELEALSRTGKIELPENTIAYRELLRILQSRERVLFPANHCHPISRSFGVALNWQQFLRVATGLSLNVEKKEHEKATSFAKKPRQYFLAPSTVSNQGDEELLTGQLYRICFRAKNSSDLRKKVGEKLKVYGRMSHPVITLYKFAYALRNRAINTIREHIKYIIEGFFPILDYIAKSNMPITDQIWPEWFYEYLQRLPLPSGRLERTIRALRLFRKFLISEGLLSPSDCEPIGAFKNNYGSVDANIITFHEFDLVLDGLVQRDNWSRFKLMLAGAAILGFYCGLRASEVSRRLIVEFDVSNGKVRSIIVQINRFGKTKSSSSTRIVPAGDLIPDRHAWVLPMLIELRRIECEHNDAPLFAKPDDSHYSRPNTLLNPLMGRMRKVTRDANLRFHHLRHSFANWLYLRLMSRTYPTILHPSIHAFSHDEFSASRIEQLFQTQLYQGYQMLDIIKCISVRMGHASVTTTMKSYLHMEPLIRFAIACEEVTSLNNSTLAMALGLARSGLDKRVKNGDRLQALDYWARKNHHETPDMALEAHPPGNSQEPLERLVPAMLMEANACPIESWSGKKGLIAILAAMSDTGAKAWSDKLQGCLLAWERQRQRSKKSRKQILVRPSRMNVPRSNRDQQTAARLLECLLHSSEKGTLKRLVELFRDFGSNKNFEIRASEFRTAREIIRGFESLGFVRENIFLKLACPTNYALESQQALIQQWSQESRIAPEQVQIYNRRTGKAGTGTAYLTLWDKKNTRSDGTMVPLGEPVRFALETYVRMLWISET